MALVSDDGTNEDGRWQSRRHASSDISQTSVRHRSDINHRAAAAAIRVWRPAPGCNTDTGAATANDEVQQHGNDADNERAPAGSPEVIDHEVSAQQEARSEEHTSELQS